MAGHHHPRRDDSHDVEIEVGRSVIVWLAMFLGLAAVATTIGLVRLWPSAESSLPSGVAAGNVVEGATFPAGEVTTVEPFDCTTLVGAGTETESTPDQGGTAGGAETSAGADDTAVCAHVSVSVASGPEEGDTVTVDVSDHVVNAGIAAGDDVTLLRFPTTGARGGEATYSFFDLQRGRPMALLAAIFVVVVIAVARWRGLRALVGLGIAGYLLVRLAGFVYRAGATFVGEQVEAVCDGGLVEIWHRGVLVASHAQRTRPGKPAMVREAGRVGPAAPPPGPR